MHHRAISLPGLLAGSLLVAACVSPQPAPPRAAETPDPACPSGAPATGETPLELRTYHVPAGRAEELAQVLRQALYVNQETPARGKVQQLDGDELVVLATPTVHSGIAELCREFESEPAAPAPATIEVHYWLVLGEPGDDGDLDGLPRAITPALEAIVEETGPRHFTVLDTADVSSVVGARAEAEGGHASFRQTASLLGDRIVADLDMRLVDAPSRLDTRVVLDPGKLVVVGQSGHRVSTGPEASRTSAPTLFYIVQGRVQPAA